MRLVFLITCMFSQIAVALAPRRIGYRQVSGAARLGPTACGDKPALRGRRPQQDTSEGERIIPVLASILSDIAAQEEREARELEAESPA
jgi:hypothetical protein